MGARTRRDGSRYRAGQKPAALVILVILTAAWWGWQHGQSRLSTPSSGTPATVRIGTWNIRQFSDRPAIDLRKIADIIESSHMDLLAIQEVKRNGEAVEKLLDVLGPPWRATAISERTGNGERFAFVYRADRVHEIGQAHSISAPDADVFDRLPYQASFRAGQFDFVLLTVHLSYSDTSRRRREARTLAGIAKHLAEAGSEKDILVLGDFNEIGQGNLEFFDGIGWRRLIDRPTNLGSRDILDNILIDPGLTREYADLWGVVSFDETLFKNNDRLAASQVSDHRPAYADFVTNLPDDD